MKLFNVVVTFDVYACSESSEAAREAVLQFIRDQAEPLATSTSVGIEVRREVEVREAWRGEKPIVAADVSDADFETVKGKTTLDVFAMLHKKEAKK